MEFISYSGMPYASLVSPSLGGTVKTRRAQVLSYEDGRGVYLGKAIATGKLKNAANNLKYYAKYRKSADRAAYEYLYRRVDKIEALAVQVAEIEGGCVDEVRGALLNAEGRGAALYWEGVQKMVRVRPSMLLAADPTATTLSILLSMATTEGSERTIPSALTYTSVFAVPRSTAMSRLNRLPNISFPSSHRAGTLAPIAPMLPQVLFKLSVYWMHSEVREGA